MDTNSEKDSTVSSSISNPSTVETMTPEELAAAREQEGRLLREQLAGLDRTPFREVLADFLESKPSKRNIRALAAENPEKWVQALNVLGKMSNYSEKTGDTTLNVYANLQLKSDAEIMVYLENQFADAGLRNLDLRRLMRGETIEGEIVAGSGSEG